MRQERDIPWSEPFESRAVPSPSASVVTSGEPCGPRYRRPSPSATEIVCAELEGLEAQAAGLLDQRGGIDWLLSDGQSVATLTARVQYVEPTASITVGSQELVRWERAFEASATGTNWVTPEYLAHAYIDEPGTGQFMLGAVTQTESVYHFMQEHPNCVDWKTNHDTGRKFGVIDLQCFWEEGFEADFYIGDACESFRGQTGRPFVVRSMTRICSRP